MVTINETPMVVYAKGTRATESGNKIIGNKLKEYQAEFEKLRKICDQPGTTVFY